MSYRILAPALICAALLSGCLTKHVAPVTSTAVVQARTAASTKPAACMPGGLEAISPVDMEFGFDAAVVSEEGMKHLTDVAHWLGCNPGVEVVIKPAADNHGDEAHLTDLAHRRATAVVAQLRGLGATQAVIRTLARDGADPVTAPHLVINAVGRGW